jgi:hypothetical protein
LIGNNLQYSLLKMPEILQKGTPSTSKAGKSQYDLYSIGARQNPKQCLNGVNITYIITRFTLLPTKQKDRIH